MTCEEFKFVHRPAEDVEKIRVIQEAVRKASILRQADEIRAATV